MTQNSKTLVDSILASKAARFSGVVVAVLISLASLWDAQCTADDTAVQKYSAEWRDGTTTPASPLSDWKFEEKLFGRGVPSKIDNTSIMGRRLFDPSNLVRIIRHSELISKLASPHIEFCNGDIVPGIIVAPTFGRSAKNRNQTDDSKDDATEFVSAIISNPLATTSGDNSIRVRTDSIRRIMFTATSNRPFTPGLIVYRNGQDDIAERLRWTPEGLRLLLKQSAKLVLWSELAEVHVPYPQDIATILRDSMVTPAGELDILGRLATKAGAAITFHCDRVFSAKVRWTYYHLLQPAWSDTGILVPIDDIASVEYRQANEVLLSRLPASTLSEKSLAGVVWPWRRDRNVHGQPLTVDGRVSATGIGTHSFSEVAFDLPPRAKSFSCLLGIDDAVGRGGCVRCKVYVDDVTEAPAAFASAIIRGNDDPVRVDIGNLDGVNRLILVTEFGHNDRPHGADPLDIRDVVSWQDTIVRIDLPIPRSTEIELTELVPQLRGWTVSDPLRWQIAPDLKFISNDGRWLRSLNLAAPGPDGSVDPLVLTREVEVDINNAWLVASSGRDDSGPIGYRVTIHANSEKVPGSEGYDGNTTGYSPGTFDRVLYSLGKYKGQKITVTVRASPAKNDASELAGIIWDELAFTPLIGGLGDNGQPLKPDIKLESIESLRFVPMQDSEPRPADKPTDDLPITLRWFPMASGLRVQPQIDSVTCKLEPRFKSFVACIGPAEQSRGAIQSFHVLIDDKVVYESGQFTRLSRAQQIVVPLPTDESADSITLRVINETSNHSVWANAGFMLK